MFDTETFIREVMKRPALYSSTTRESGDNKMAHWEEIGMVIYKDWPPPHRPEERMDRIRELRKKWKSVRDNFLRDMKSPSSRKKRYVYHDLMTFLIPHLDPRRWNSGEEDCSDGDFRPSRKKKDNRPAVGKAPGNREFLLSLAPLLDRLADQELARVRQEVIWAVETVGQAERERRIIAHVASYPALWQCAIPPYFSDGIEDTDIWLQISQELDLPVDECKKIWEDLTSDLKRHLEQPEPREKWKYEEEMTFVLPYLLQDRSADVKKEGDDRVGEEAEDEDEDEEIRLPVELCQVECPGSPSEMSGDTLTEFFINMARTVATFPPRLQAHVKSEVFRAVNTAEIELHSAAAPVHPLHMSLQIQEVPQPLPSVSKISDADTGLWMGKTEHI